jgi:hypothetical protein
VLSERAKLGLLCLLLLLILGCLAFTTVDTFQAVRNFQQQYSAVKAGDVSTVHPWMTVHAVSHIYQVPENYLYRSLQIGSPGLFRHATLYEIANRKRQPVDQVIRTVQHAILAYRKEHPHFLTPSPALQTDMNPLSPTPKKT